VRVWMRVGCLFLQCQVATVVALLQVTGNYRVQLSMGRGEGEPPDALVPCVVFRAAFSGLNV